jgi:hypothetical protein
VRQRRPNGWSLIELAVVFVVIAVMAGAAAPRLVAMRRNARIKATAEELLVLSWVVVDYSKRCPKSTGTVRSFDITGAGHAGTIGTCTNDPSDMIRFMLPTTFDGTSPYGNKYEASVEWLGGITSDIETWTCVPVADFAGYKHPTGLVVANCGPALHPCAECSLDFIMHVVPTGVAAAVVHEKELTHPGFTESSVGTRGSASK